MAIDQQATAQQQAGADEFISLLTTLRDDFERQAASVRKESQNRPFTLAAAWLTDQEQRIWQQIFGAAPRRREILRSMLAYWALPVEVRSAQSGRVRQFDHILHAFAHDLLRCACRTRDPVEYQRALTAFILGEQGRNWRETQASLCLYWHAARRLKLDVKTIFETLAISATPGASEMLQEFAGRSATDQRLDVFGLTERDLDCIFLVE